MLFASKIYSDFQLATGNNIRPLDTKRGPLDVIAVGAGGFLAPICINGGLSVVVVIAPDKASIAAAAADLPSAPQRMAALTHPLYMDKWDRYSLGVWQGIGDFARDPKYKTPEEFYQWMGQIGLNPQINMGRYTVDGAVNDNVLAWLRAYFKEYGVKYQFVEWLINQPDLYNRNAFLGQTLNPHVTTRWDYYGEDRVGAGPLRDIQNATYAGLLKDTIGDPNQMAILDPDGEIGPFMDAYWGASGPKIRRDFVQFLRDVRKFTLDDVSLRYYGKPGVLKSWDDVTLADYRDFYGWTTGSVDLAGEWRFQRDDNHEGYSGGWGVAKYDDSDWVRLSYPGDTMVYSLVSGSGPLWMRKTVKVDAKAFNGPILLSVAPLSGASVQVFVNGRLAGSIDPHFHTARTFGQFDITSDVAKANGSLTVALRMAAGDAPNGPVFLTTKKAEEFPTSDPLVNARRYDHIEFIDWDVAQGVAATLKTIRSMEPNRPIKVHAYGSSPWGWKTVAQYGGYSHHTGSGPGWSWNEPHQFGASRGLQDSSETGGPVDNLRDLKGLFGNLIFMGKNAHDYFISLESITKDPAMRSYFEAKLPSIKVMGRASVVLSPIAVINGKLNTYYQGEFARWEDWRYGTAPARGGEMTPNLDEVRIREGNLGEYRAIVDPGTENWDADEASALKAYVTAGGVLVLNNLSGRNDFVHRLTGTGPACKLAGVTFGPSPAAAGSMTFASTDTLYGSALGRVGVENRYGVPAYTLVPDTGTTVIATWPDGTPAATRRAVGTGAVYYFGNSIMPGAAMSALATAFGPSVYAKVEGGCDLMRTLRSNNGCEDLIMVRGLGGKPATIHWTFDYTPSGIYDPVTGKPIDATIDGHTATFTVTIDDWDFQWYAAKRPSADEAFSHWVTRQTQIWNGVTPPSATPVPAVYRHLDLSHDWKLAQTDTIDAAKALMPLDDIKAGLKPTTMTLWTAPGTGLKPRAAGLYRRTFDLPKEWLRESLFTLSMRGQIHDTPLHGWVGNSEVFLNGQSIWSGPKLDIQNIDVTGRVLPAHNKLEIVHEGVGVMPSIMLVRSAKPESTIDLAGQWNGVNDQHTEVPATVPGTITNAFVYRDVSVPASAAGKEIWIRVDGQCPFVYINGRVRYWDMGGPGCYAGFPTYEIDITPDIRIGQTNRIAIGGSMFNGWRPGRYNLDHVELALYNPGAWSPDGTPPSAALTPRELASVKSDLSTVQLYPMVHAATVKSALSLIPADAEGQPLALPAPILDLDLHPAGAVAKDKGPNALPVVVKGNVEPITEARGKITGVYFHGESASPGQLAIKSSVLRRAVEGKDLTMRAWIKPMAINRAGGTLADNIDYAFHWGIGDTGTSLNLGDPPGRRLIAEDVIRQRTWQSVTFTLSGTVGTMYVNGVPVGVQTWNKPFPGIDAPFWIGISDEFREPINAKLAAFTIYPGALSGTDVAKLYLKERGAFDEDQQSAFPENDIFRLSTAGDTFADAAEIPATMESANVTVKHDEPRPYLSFSGTKSYILVHDHPRARHYAGPFSLIWDMRRDAGAGGMIFRHFHILCLNMSPDGSLVFDANIGRRNMITFPKAVPAGKWSRFMFTYDGKTACLYRDGEKLGEQAYTAGFGTSDFPISLFVDRTIRFPDYGNVRGDLREYRLISGILTKMPDPLP